MRHEIKIEGLLGQTAISGLIDTGATLSYISEDTFNSDILKPYRKDRNIIISDLLIELGDGSTLNSGRAITLPIIIDDRKYTVKFHVIPNLARSFIFGRDFCRQNKIILDMSNNSYHFKDELNRRDTAQTFLYLIDDCCVPAYSATSSPVKLSTKISPVEGDLFCEKSSKLAQRFGIFAASGVVGAAQANTSFLFHLANLSNKNVLLPKKTIVGVCRPVKEGEIIDTNNDSQSVFDTLNLLKVNETLTSPESESEKHSLIDYDDHFAALYEQFKIDDSRFSEEEGARIKALIYEFRDIFKDEPSTTYLATHHIDLSDDRPINQSPYRKSRAERDIICTQVETMLKNNIVEPSRSPWASPVVLIPKPDGSMRFCIDYRKLNDVTIRDVYPLPRIDDSLALLGGNQFFSSLDMAAGYWQIAMADKDKNKTAFITEDGLYHFKVMPFGLNNAPATFQRLMDAVLAGLKWKTLLVYLDDIIVFSSSFDRHIKDLHDAFIRIREANLRLKANKCSLFSSELKYLGFIVSREGIRPNPDKVKAILNMPAPNCATEARSFIGKCNYYRGHIPWFSKLMDPIYNTLLVTKKFLWTSKANQNFKEIKEHLAQAPLLRHPDFDLLFKLQTDACDTGIGGVLSQKFNGVEHPIWYLSRQLSPAEKKWCPREKEALAIIWACEKCRPYLIGVKFTIETDHHSLQWLQKAKSPARLVRWALRLSEYDFDIKYRKGDDNSNADALSRLADPSEEASMTNLDDRMTIFALDIKSWKEYDFDVNKMKTAQDDSGLRTLIQECRENGNISVCAKYELNDGLLFKKNPGRQPLLMVPPSFVEPLLRLYHNNELAVHLSRDRLYNLLRKRFYWIGMYMDVANWVNACLPCRRFKPPQPTFNGLLLPIVTVKPFETVGLDIIGPIHRSNSSHKYILVAIDLFTNWVEACPLRSITAEEVTNSFFKIIITRHGCPLNVLTDQGSQFKTLFKSLCNDFEIKHLTTTAYHQQCNGKVEKFNNFLITSLATIAKSNQSNWADLIDNCLMIYRTTVSRTLKDSPFFLLYGRDPVLPQDLKFGQSSWTGDSPISLDDLLLNHKTQLLANLKDAYNNLLNTKADYQKTYKDYYDKSHVEKCFAIDDLVMIYTKVPKKGLSLKLLPKWDGPFRISERLDTVTYRVESIDGTKIMAVHVQRMRKYRPWIDEERRVGIKEPGQT